VVGSVRCLLGKQDSDSNSDKLVARGTLVHLNVNLDMSDQEGANFGEPEQQAHLNERSMPTRPQSIFSPGGQSPIEMNINLGYGAHKASHKEVSINPEVHAEHILSGAVPAINETTIRMDWPGEGGPHFSGHPA